MKMVYVVYRSNCPEDEVVGVLSSRDEAKNIADSDNDIYVNEFPLDAIDDLFVFEFKSDREGNVLSVECVHGDVPIENTTIYRQSIVHVPFSTLCWARDETQATEIGLERFSKLISDNDGTFPDKGYFTIEL